MDEDDSPDEQINRSSSQNKGKRAALWAISDDSDDVEEESEEGESDSGDEDDGEEEEGEEENDEEEDMKGPLGETSADLAGMSSDEDADKCPICLNSFSSQPVATPETCEHYFCLDCILEWTKNANSCPVDRTAFNNIYLRKCYGGKVQKMITVQKPAKVQQEEAVDLDLEQTNCEVCGGSDREDRLLLCDGCDAGYHMECLTPPLDAVPVEEWFCPECVASNNHSRASAEEVSDAESLPSTAHPVTSRSLSRAAGPTRAIARTQQSERVRANVNRHRITQARSSQLAPTYLMQSTWLDETINAVVAGLNTAVYVRDFTSHVPSGRRHGTRKRRKVQSKRTSSANGKNGHSASTRVRRRKRKVRKTKSRKKLVGKKTATPRRRIASNLGIAKDKKGSSLPTVYRPSEQTLSSMRADIGAASLSVYGDPFDLDPFVDECEEDEQQEHITSLLEAKRRGISRSALRSHQPVARPVTASLSRRGMEVPHAGGVVEAAPVPDLLGSILSGQSMLLMDSSDVVINRDGSLKATKSMSLPSAVKPGCSKSSSAGESRAQISPGDSSSSPQYSSDLPGSSSSTPNRPFSQSPSIVPHFTIPSTSHAEPIHLTPRGHSSSQPLHTNRRLLSPMLRGSNGIGAPRESTSSSTHTGPDSSSTRKAEVPAQSQTKKAPTKPMWVDVSVLPRIPKIKRESSSRGNGISSNSSTSTNGYGLPETGMNSLAGDENRQQGIDQQKGRADHQAQRHRSDGAGSSSAFSNSFSSSSSTGCPSTQPCHSSLSTSSSSAISFRINSSGNSWHSRRLSTTSASGGSIQDHWRDKANEARKRQLHRDKQMLLASCMPVSKELNSNNIYDPFNPTLSDSDSSDSESENPSLLVDSSSKNASLDPSLGNKQEQVHVKTETEESEVSQDELLRANVQESPLQASVRCSEGIVKVEKESRLVDTKIEKQTLPGIRIKTEPGLDDIGQAERCSHSFSSNLSSETQDFTSQVHTSPVNIKPERGIQEEESGQNVVTPSSVRPYYKNDSSASSSASSKRKQKAEIRSDSKSPSKDLSHKKKTLKKSVPSKERRSSSSSSERDRGRSRDHHASNKGRGQRERSKDREKSSRRSRSRERRKRKGSSSNSSRSNSPERTHRKRHQSRSQSKDRQRSRSCSSSSSRERSRRKMHKQPSHDEGERGRERRRVFKDKRHEPSRSKDHSRSKSKSRSRSRSRERRKDHTRPQQSSVSSRDKGEARSKDKCRRMSRSSSREKRKDVGSSKSVPKTLGSSFFSSNDRKEKKEKDTSQNSLTEEMITRAKKQDISSTSSFTGKKESEDLSTNCQATTAETMKEKMVSKDIKKEKLPFVDMFEDSPITKSIKKECVDTPFLIKAEGTKEEGIKKNLIKIETCEIIKTESCEIATIKNEPSSPEVCHLTPVTSFSTLTTPAAAATLQEPHSSLDLKAPVEQPNTVPIKQEGQQQPSDSDDEFNVDVMLDNLDYVKCERGEGRVAAIKPEKDEKPEGEQVSAMMGAKSKTPGKRVTWNIQEPESPQPEKSASKLALYKLKLKQEGARRPSSTVQTTSQDSAGPGTVGDPSKRDAVGLLSTKLSSDGGHPERLSTSEQGEAEEEDSSRKDKQYLKKLHMQERAIEEVKLAIKPFYQRRDINKDEYKEILRKAVQKVCHSRSGEINPVKVGNLVKAYVDKYKHARKQKKGEDSGKTLEVQTEPKKTSVSP
ncbi:uncharacterized protein phrf1 [Aulostomus maculatus]